MLDQVEQQRFRPLEVIDREHHRLGGRKAGKEPAHDEEGLLGRRGRPGKERADAGGDTAAIGVVARQRGIERRSQVLAAGGVVDAEDGAHRPGDRREGRAAGRLALGGEHGRPVEAAGELVEQARLAETRRAEDHRQAGGRGRHGRVVDCPDAPQLVVAADERRRRRSHRAVERHHPVSRHGLGSTLEREDAEGRQRHQRPHQALGRLADQHVAVARLLLQAGGDVERIADAGGVVVADDHLAGVDRDAQADRADGIALRARELAKGALDAHRGAHGADGVVLGHTRHAEGAHDAVAEKLHDGAAVGLDRNAHGAVIALHHAADGLGIEPLVQCRRADQIREDDRDYLARFGFLSGGGGTYSEGYPAGDAEPSLDLMLGAARRAAWSERLAAAGAEARDRRIRSPAARAAHGGGSVFIGAGTPSSCSAASRARARGRRRRG